MPDVPKVSGIFPRRLSWWRDNRRLTTQKLADLMDELGEPIHPSAITKIEKGRREVTLDEWIAFSAALNVPPVALILPLDGKPSRVHLTRKSEIHPHLALEWAIGQEPLVNTRRTVIDQAEWQSGSQEVRLWMRLRQAENEVHKAYFAVASDEFVKKGRFVKKDDAMRIEDRRGYVDWLKELLRVRTQMERNNITPPRLSPEWSRDIKALRLEGED